MKKTVEEKAEIAKRKIDNKMQKQKLKAEKNAAKKEKKANKKAAKKEKNASKKAAKKEAKQQKKATKQQVSAEKKELKKQKIAAKKEASQLKKQKKLEAKNKMKEIKTKAKQGQDVSDEKLNDVQEATTKNAKKAKTKVKKEKVKKEKKPKKSKNADGEQLKTGGNKKVLFIGLLALVFAGGGVVGFLHFRGGEKEENTDPYIEAYVLDDDFVTSIPKFLEQSETRELPEITVEEGENKQIIYDYTNLKGAAKEVKDYVNYLTTENDFVPMFDFNTDAPAGYVSVATASAEEGKILKLDIDYTDKDYKVMISKTTENLPKPKTKENESSGTRDGALNYLTSFSAEELGLQKPVDEYKTIYDAGQSSIANHSCYGISLYELGRAGTNEYVGKFFVSLNQSAIFRYDSATSTYTEIANTSKMAKAQQPENIEITENIENEENTEDTENTEDMEEQKDKDKKDEKFQKGRKTERQDLEEMEQHVKEKETKKKQV